MAGEASTPIDSFWGFNSAEISPENDENNRGQAEEALTLSEEKVGINQESRESDVGPFQAGNEESHVDNGGPAPAESEEKSVRASPQEFQELMEPLDFTLDHFGPGRDVEEPDASDSIVDQVNPVGRSLGYQQPPQQTGRVLLVMIGSV